MGLFDSINRLDKIWKGARLLNQAQAIYDSLVRSYTSVDAGAMMAEMNRYNERLSKANQYKLVLNSPNFLSNMQTSSFFDIMDIFTKGVSVPSTNLSQKVTRVGTSRRSVAGVVDTDTFTMTIYDTDNNFFHTYFMLWMTSNRTKNNGIMYYPDDFNGDASLFRSKNDDREQLLETYKMTKMYPIAVSDLRFDDDELDSFQVFDVTFYTNELQMFDKQL